MNLKASPEAIRADQERRRSNAAVRVDGAKLKLARNRAAGKRAYRREVW